jgi:carboxymethylenebutenolidase
MGITTERVDINGMGAYLARPDGDGTRGAVIVWMEIFGVNPHIQSVTDRVAAEGYVALAPDFFHRTGPGIELAYDEAGMNKGISHLTQLKADQMIADAQGALTYLRGRSDVLGDKIGVMGFCIGGHMTYLTACEADVAAAASFYGGGISAAEGPGGAASTLSRSTGISCPILCLYGAKDAHIPLDQVDQVRSALNAAGTQHEVIVYDDADHGFFCDRRESYHKASADDAWTRVKALFKSNLG